MSRALLLIAALGLAVPVVAANAQTFAIPSSERPASMAVQVPTRINVGMNINQRMVGNSVDEQRRAEQAIRRRLYEMAMQECAVLVDVFAAECKLTSLNVNTNVQGNADVPMLNISVNGQYEMIPRR